MRGNNIEVDARPVANVGRLVMIHHYLEGACRMALSNQCLRDVEGSLYKPPPWL